MRHGKHCGTAAAESIERHSRYLASGLLEGHPQQLLRQRYHKLLTGKDVRSGGVPGNKLRLAENMLAMGDHAGALREIERLSWLWPGCEEVWLMGLRAAVESRDGKAVAEWIGRIRKAPVRLSAEASGMLRFWTDIQADDKAEWEALQ